MTSIMVVDEEGTNHITQGAQPNQDESDQGDPSVTPNRSNESAASEHSSTISSSAFPSTSKNSSSFLDQSNCCFYCLASWRVWFRQLVMFVYIVLFIVAFSVILMGMQSYNINQFTSANFLAGVAMLFTVPMSLWGISQHLINYTNPTLQKYIIRVLWMVPIYSVLSFCGLHFTQRNVILDAVKDCYEAFVVYSFTCYLVRYLQQQQTIYFNSKSASHIFPFCCMSSWAGHDSIVNCTIGVLQYTLVKPIVTVVTVITSILHVYKEGAWDLSAAWIYIMVLSNASQIWALYCLVLFYRTFKQELTGSRPVAKFLCIKLVIFATWWQSLGISFFVEIFHLRRIRWIADSTKNDVEVSHAIQDFTVCFEMFVAAIAHHYAFTHREFKDLTQQPRVRFITAFKNMFDIRDVGSDFISHGHIVHQKVKDRIKGNGRTRLENESDLSSTCHDSSSTGARSQHRTKPSADGPQTLVQQSSSGIDAEKDGGCSPLSISIPPDSSAQTTVIVSPGIDRTEEQPVVSSSKELACSLQPQDIEVSVTNSPAINELTPEQVEFVACPRLTEAEISNERLYLVTDSDIRLHKT